jgi:formylglycine-generating enzyme required for sulfatase activity
MMLIQRIFLLLISSFLFLSSCSIEFNDVKRTKYSCVQPTAITAQALSSNNPYDITVSLVGNSTDVSEVIWTVTKGTNTLSKTVSSSPFRSTFTITGGSGSYSVSAAIKNACGELSSLQTVYNPACPQASSITIANANAPSSVVLSLNGNISDVSRVEWNISRNGVSVYNSIQTSSPFSATTPAIALAYEGKLDVSAKITAACAGSYDLSGSYDYYFVDVANIQGGTFFMGSTTGDSDEQPIHNVTVSSFYFSKYEVTIADFRRFVEASSYVTDAEKSGFSNAYVNGSWQQKSGVNWRYNSAGSIRNATEDKHPVVHVSWNDAVAYCKWLSTKIGRTCRLPTEAEWEYAAKGGSSSQNYIYAGSNTLSNVAWYADNSSLLTHEIGGKQANELGLYDMTGNVWEWCNDWYGQYGSVASTNPTAPTTGTYRVLRGASWYNPADVCRINNRDITAPGDTYGAIGFRIVIAQ